MLSGLLLCLLSSCLLLMLLLLRCRLVLLCLLQVLLLAWLLLFALFLLHMVQAMLCCLLLFAGPGSCCARLHLMQLLHWQ